ncbi:MAG: histidinol dehydrogenase [Proteobacteria bacterium]|nr:histidinol dehydrogenase [Pseudomonadota bacterium]
MTAPLLRTLTPAQLPTLGRAAVDAETLAAAARIVDEVRQRGEPALRAQSERLGDLRPGEALVIPRAGLQAALDGLAAAERAVLERTAERIRAFAAAQRACLLPLTLALPGGAAGHVVAPVASAGCYAPGGRFPLPSSVLMTVITARAAGVETVWVASPRPAAVTLAAAAVAGADALLAAGGAQAIAALAYGAGPVPACDAVVGPGNRWVTAAKQLVAGQVAIDMLAGPSELVVLADQTGDPALIAADLLAQAEHDDDALPVLVTTAPTLIDAVRGELVTQLATLPTAATARVALTHGFAVLVEDLVRGAAVCDQLAPEHLQLHVADAPALAARLRHYGALFIGARAAEVLGDYGAGPNHVLPTGGTARTTGGLSVLTFLRTRTWLRFDDEGGRELVADAVALARLEGLEAHARAAARRLPDAAPRHRP